MKAKELSSSYQQFLKGVRQWMPKDHIYTDDLHCLAWGTDAGFYRLLPKIVIRSRSEEDIVRLMQLAQRYKVPVTFRAAGTSLSGQAVTDSVLIVAGKNWEDYSVAPDASTVTLQPGIIGERVNEILRPYQRIFSPDPASKKSAMVGGIVMNNASGMNCGIHANSDRILKSVRIILADGTLLDTGDETSRQDFRRTHPEVIERIEKLRDRIRADEALSQRIRFKYSIKNVTGLNIFPFVCYDDPFDIITHLMAGSEGTLAFASQFTMETRHLYPYSSCALLFFFSMREACEAVVAMKETPVYSCELLDSKSLASVKVAVGKKLTAVLTETKADTPEELQSNISAITESLRSFKLAEPIHFTDNPEEMERYWSIRSGIFPSVGGTRPLGTTVLIEDVAFHLKDMPQACTELDELLRSHGYDDSCIYGHALNGNVHFIISQRFDSPEDVEMYRRLMLDIDALVVDKYDGSLKAEHGTGRNMAPFVRHEWGDKAYEVMKEVKAIFDPENLLNPGVIFNDDPECFIKNFKPMPMVNKHVDRCIECGFCEVNCVSCGFTLSSRQRVVVCREMARLRRSGEDPKRLARLKKQFKYYGNETCAGDGLCSTSCPMKINVGDMIRELRRQSWTYSSPGYVAGFFAEQNFPAVRNGLRPILSAAAGVQTLIGPKAVRKVGRVLHKAGLPLWTPSLPKPRYGKLREQWYVDDERPKVLYFPSCINRTMGTAIGDPHQRSLIDEVVNFFEKAGWQVIFPANLPELCCGLIWESKGMPAIACSRYRLLDDFLWDGSERGTYPVICDQSPCLKFMREKIRSVWPFELFEFIHDYVAPSLTFHPTDEPIALHFTCSTRQMGLQQKFLEMARRCSSNVFIPEGIGCCGFAGDKGFTHPELNAYALRKLKQQIQDAGIRRGFSNSRTCEIGLTEHSGIPYQSLIYLLNECTELKKS